MEFLRALSLACLLVFISTSNLFAQDEKPEDVIRVDTTLVNIPVSVSDPKGRHIPGLTVQDFKIFDDGKQQKIEYLLDQEGPISVALLLDTSRSTKEVLGKIKKAAKEFVKNLRPADRGMVVSFDNNVEVLSDLTPDTKALEKAIKHADIGYDVGTVMYDAVSNVIHRTLNQVKGRKAIILLTDGKDAGSSITRNQLLRNLEQSDTIVYSVYYETENQRPQIRPQNFPFPGGGMGRRGGGMGRRGGGMGGPNRIPPDFPRRDPDVIRQRQAEQNQMAAELLERIAELTGGRAFQKDVSDLDEAFALIAEELRKQYLIGYYPDETARSKELHNVDVKVARQDATIRAKGSYRTTSTQ